MVDVAFVTGDDEVLAAGVCAHAILVLVHHKFHAERIAEAIGVDSAAHIESVAGACRSLGVALGEFGAEYLDAVPAGSEVLFPFDDLAGLLEVMGGESVATACLGLIEA